MLYWARLRLDDQRVKPSPGLDDALDILQYFADRGNHVATERLEVIKTIWSEFLARQVLFKEHSVPWASPGALQTHMHDSVSRNSDLDAVDQSAGVSQGPGRHVRQSDSATFNQDSFQTAEGPKV
jgi:hypothetical protein